MYKITVNDSHEMTTEPAKDGSYVLDGKVLVPDLIEIKGDTFHIILNHKSYNAEVLQHDVAGKFFVIRINNNTYKIQARDHYDILLKELGMDALQSKKISDMKAPMPGLVVEIAVVEGQEVLKGDRLVVLEAMKMENVLKAPADVKIKFVNVSKGNTVEKNELLIVFA
jgi:acetyl/propionyl-CoA carboxylase alpha subunit